jgi:hypothetical protein
MREIRFVLTCLRYPPLWGAMLLAGVLYTAALQVPFSAAIEPGSFRADPYLKNFQDGAEADGRTGRWTHNYSYVTLPGTGGNRPLSVTLFQSLCSYRHLWAG